MKTIKRIRIITFFLIIELLANVLLTSPVVFGKTTVALGSTYKVPSDEQFYAEVLINHIIASASTAGYITYDLYGADTTRDNILNAANAFGDLGPDDTSFYIGHGDWVYVLNGLFIEPQWFITDNEGTLVYDKDIYPHSISRNIIFVFLWSCKQGDVIGGWHWSGIPYGMPMAWLHTNDLGNDGYASPDNGGYTFIGFDGVAPFLTNRDPQFTDGSDALYPLYSFGVEFYSAIFGYDANQRDVHDALDAAAIIVWGVRFSDCVLYTGYSISGEGGRMVVYGDGNLFLPTG
jgi:hypothetical protein